MSEHETDDALKALRAELATVTPSPEFAVRVRQGIEADAGARGAGWLSGWRWLVPTAAVVAVVIAVFAISRPEVWVPESVVAHAPVTAPAVAPSPVPALQPTSGSAPAHTLVRAAAPNPRTREPENPRTREPENPLPEVITNQPEVLRALWARVGATATLVESKPDVLPDSVPEIVVNPIEVNPIVVKSLGDPPTAPGIPIIRKVTADTAERSAK